MPEDEPLQESSKSRGCDGQRGKRQKGMDCRTSRHKRVNEPACSERDGDACDGLSDEQWCVYKHHSWG